MTILCAVDTSWAVEDNPLNQTASGGVSASLNAEGSLWEYVLGVRNLYGTAPPVVIHPAPMDSCPLLITPEHIREFFHRPSLLFWNPIQQLPNVQLSCPRELCDGTLQIATEARRTWDPTWFRMYDLDTVVYVQTYRYSCTQDGTHSHNALVASLDRNTMNFLPGLFFTRVAVSWPLLHDLVEHVSSGMSFTAFEGVVEARYQSRWHMQDVRAHTWRELTRPQQIAATQPGQMEWRASPGYFLAHTPSLQCPSDDILRDALRAYYREHEDFFVRSMASLSIDTLRIDHTFRVAMNIGFFRNAMEGAQKRWMCQYSSAFFCLNGDNQVVTWRFCRNQRHSSIRGVLQALLKRGGKVKQVYTDQCCTDRKFLRSIFGSDLLVFLDTFHFKQRLCRSLTRKTNQAHYWLLCAMTKDLFAVGKEWTKQAMEDWVIQWEEKCRQLGMHTKKVHHACQKAIGHIRNGCLDQHRVGTQPNENLHKHMKRVLPSGRQGVDLAVALFTLFLHKHNWNQQHSHDLATKLHRRAHEAVNPDLPHTEECFGTCKRDSGNIVDDNIVRPCTEQEYGELWARASRDVDTRDLVCDLFLHHPDLVPHDVTDVTSARLIYKPKDVDGQCFYHTLSHALASKLGIRLSHTELHGRLVEHLRNEAARYSPFFIHGEETYDAAVDRLNNCWQTQLGDFVVQAAANIWGVVIVVHQPDVEPLIIVPEEGQTTEVLELQFEQQYYVAIDTHDDPLQNVGDPHSGVVEGNNMTMNINIINSTALDTAELVPKALDTSELESLLQDKYNLRQHFVAPDGNCFYLALCDQLYQHNAWPTTYSTQTSTVAVANPLYPLQPPTIIHGQFAEAARQARAAFVAHAHQHVWDNADYVDDELFNMLVAMGTDGTYAGGHELQMAADMYNIHVHCLVVSADGLDEQEYLPQQPPAHGIPHVYMCLHGNHFWSTRPLATPGQTHNPTSVSPSVGTIPIPAVEPITYHDSTEPGVPRDRDDHDHPHIGLYPGVHHLVNNDTIYEEDPFVDEIIVTSPTLNFLAFYPPQEGGIGPGQAWQDWVHNILDPGLIQTEAAVGDFVRCMEVGVLSNDAGNQSTLYITFTSERDTLRAVSIINRGPTVQGHTLQATRAQVSTRYRDVDGHTLSDPSDEEQDRAEVAAWEAVGHHALQVQNLAAVTEPEPPRKKQKVVQQVPASDLQASSSSNVTPKKKQSGVQHTSRPSLRASPSSTVRHKGKHRVGTDRRTAKQKAAARDDISGVGDFNIHEINLLHQLVEKQQKGKRKDWVQMTKQWESHRKRWDPKQGECPYKDRHAGTLKNYFHSSYQSWMKKRAGKDDEAVCAPSHSMAVELSSTSTTTSAVATTTTTTDAGITGGGGSGGGTTMLPPPPPPPAHAPRLQLLINPGPNAAHNPIPSHWGGNAPHNPIPGGLVPNPPHPPSQAIPNPAALLQMEAHDFANLMRRL